MYRVNHYKISDKHFAEAKENKSALLEDIGAYNIGDQVALEECINGVSTSRKIIIVIKEIEQVDGFVRIHW